MNIYTFTMGLSGHPDNIHEQLETTQQEITSSQDIIKVTSETQKEISSTLDYSTATKSKKGTEILDEKRIRIYLLRHYPEIGTSGKYYQNIDDVSENLKQAYDGIFSNLQKILFIYDSEKSLARVRSTAEDLLKKYPIPINQIIKDSGLAGSYNSHENPTDRKIRTLNEFKQLRSIIQERNLSEIETIVIVSNRTYSQPFDLLSGDKKDITQDLLEMKGYLCRDFDGSLNPIIPTSTSLIIYPEIYQSLQNIFPEIESDSPQDLQKKIEVLFSNKTFLYRLNLRETLLRSFCLANLIIQQDYTAIENYYLSPECTHLSNEEKMIFLKNIKKPEAMKIFRKLFVSKPKLWENEESELFKGQTELYTLLKQSRLAYTTATGLQSNSLDPLIKTGRENAVIERQLYYEEEDVDKNPDMQKEQNEKKIVRRDFDPDMFLKLGKYSKFIIRAHVGEGKSIYLSELVKQLSLEQDKEVRFVIAKNLKEEDIVNLFCNINIIVCIDALDEMNEAIKKRIKEEFKSFKGRCIVSTRHSETFGINESTCILQFNLLDSTKYIDSRFREDITNATKVKEWIEKQGLASEVKGNPLLLNLIVLLASASDEDRKWMEDYKILSYDQIKTKSDLYENVVKFVLAKHSKELKKQDFDPDEDLSTWMKKLGEYAFDIFSDNPEKNTKKYFDSHLSILFKSEENGEYNFIHKSFYDYFLARHLAKMENNEGSQKIYSYRDKKMKGNWNDWRDFRSVVLFYGEELVKTGKYNELIEFLGEKGLLKNDDIFGENFFMGLETLYKLPEDINGINPIKEVLESYNREVEEWDIEKIMWRFNGIKSFIRNRGYIETSVSLNIILKIEEFYQGNEDIQMILENGLTLAELGTEKSLEHAIYLVNVRVHGKRRIDEVYRICKTILQFGTAKSCEISIKGVNSLFESGYFDLAGELCIAIAKKGIHTIGMIKNAGVCAEMLEKNKLYTDAGFIYLKLVKSGYSNFYEKLMYCYDICISSLEEAYSSYGEFFGFGTALGTRALFIDEVMDFDKTLPDQRKWKREIVEEYKIQEVSIEDEMDKLRRSIVYKDLIDGVSASKKLYTRNIYFPYRKKFSIL